MVGPPGPSYGRVLATPAANAEQPHPFAGDRQVTVMTRNLYLGTDLAPIFAAPNQLALLAAAGTRWAQVQANDFPARAEAMADEIATAEPDLVGLQEGMLYRTDFPPDGPTSAAGTTVIEFVELLKEALARRGLDYDAVSTFTGTDVEVPAGLPPALDVRMTDRVVILARGDESTADLKLSNAQSSTYASAFTVQTPAGTIRAPRGWASVDVKVRGTSFRFVTTHLEAFSRLVRNPQAAEPPSRSGSTSCSPRAGSRRFRRTSSEKLRQDRTASGLWPSDHAGVVATLRLPTDGADRD